MVTGGIRTQRRDCMSLNAVDTDDPSGNAEVALMLQACVSVSSDLPMVLARLSLANKICLPTPTCWQAAVVAAHRAAGCVADKYGRTSLILGQSSSYTRLESSCKAAGCCSGAGVATSATLCGFIAQMVSKPQRWKYVLVAHLNDCCTVRSCCSCWSNFFGGALTNSANTYRCSTKATDVIS